ncbi:hypothetical protein BDV93DRAFT_565871 [Ceratobasidium sp. AG-I]|nr:hypothetical protein BDV93DRAFT_565871 [Ceratobasidium sp. AG-I]
MSNPPPDQDKTQDDTPLNTEMNVPRGSQSTLHDKRPAEPIEPLPSTELDTFQDIEAHPDALRVRFQHQFGAIRKVSGLDAKFLEEYEMYVLGCAVVRFYGPGGIESVCRISEDPNDRANPRTLVREHMNQLRKSIDQHKHDWDKPLVFMLSASLLSEQMRKDMKKVPAFTRVAQTSFLELMNITDEEKKLDQEIRWHRVDGAPKNEFLTAAEVAQRVIVRDKLRLKRDLAMLLNGNHRIHVGLERVSELYQPLLDEVVELSKRVFRDEDQDAVQEWKAKVKAMEELANEHTWQVLVVSDDAPELFRHQLMANTEHDPQLGENDGEAVWMIATGILASAKRWEKAFPNESRGEIFDRVHFELEAERKRKLLAARGGGALGLNKESPIDVDEQPEGSTERKQKKTKAEKKKDRKQRVAEQKAKKEKEKEKEKENETGGKRSGVVGGVYGKEMWMQVTTEPVTLEMLLSTRSCLIAYTTIMGTTYVNTLLQSGSGVLAALFWLSVETLIKITNASNDEAVPAADNFLAEHDDIVPDGYEAAIEHWDDLRSVGHDIPLGLKAFTLKAADHFGEIWTKLFPNGPKADNGYLEQNWTSPAVLIKSRQAFDTWGQWIIRQDKDSPAHLRTGIAARIFARLPTWNLASVQAISDETPQSQARAQARFHPRATLPTKSTVTQWVRVAKELGNGAGGAFEALEYMIEPVHHMWSAASGDPGTKCRSNWYGSGHGTYYVLMSFFKAEKYGSIESRLSLFLHYMGSAEVHRALVYANNAIDPAHTLEGKRKHGEVPKIAGLKEKMGALKGEGFKPDIDTLELLNLPLDQAGLSSCQELVDLMKIAQSALRRYIMQGDPDLEHLQQIINEHPCLKLISMDYWSKAPIIWWGLGWDNSSSQRQGHTAGVIMGWGLLHDAYPGLVLTPLFLHRRAWPLIDVAEATCNALDIKPWGGGKFDEEEVRNRRHLAVHFMRPDTDWEDGSESDVEWEPSSKSAYVTGQLPKAHMKPPKMQTPSQTNAPPSPPRTKGATTRTKGESLKGKGKGKGKEAETSPGPRRSMREPKAVDHGIVPLTASRRNISGPKSSVPPPKRNTSTPARKPRILNPAPDSDEEDQHLEDPEEKLEESSEASGYEVDWDHEADAQAGDEDNGTAMDLDLDREQPVLARPPLLASDDDDRSFLYKPIEQDNSGVLHPSMRIEGDLQDDILDALESHPFALNGWMSARLTSGYIGQIVAARCAYVDKGVNDELLVRGLLVAHEDTLQVFPHIFEARRGLRHDICLRIGSVLDSHSALEALMDHLAPSLLLMKISFVKKVAMLIATYTTSTFSNSLTEAVWMASNDGLFSADSFSWDSASGAIRAELKSCFPRSMQSKLPKDGTIVIGRMRRFEERRQNWDKISHVAHIALAPGKSQAESLYRGATAGPVLQHRQWASDLPRASIARHTKLNTAKLPEEPVNQARLFSTEGYSMGLSQVPIQAGWRMHQRPSRRTQQGRYSILSTGIPAPPSFKVPTHVHETEEPAITSDIEQVREELAQYWNRACEREFIEHTRMREHFHAVRHSYVVEPPVLGSTRWPDPPASNSTVFERVMPSHSVVRRQPGDSAPTHVREANLDEPEPATLKQKRSALPKPGQVVPTVLLRTSVVTRRQMGLLATSPKPSQSGDSGESSHKLPPVAREEDQGAGNDVGPSETQDTSQRRPAENSGKNKKRARRSTQGSKSSDEPQTRKRQTKDGGQISQNP